MPFNRNRLIQLRTQKGMAACQLAKASKLPKSTITRIEKGITKNPRFETIEAIAACLKVNIETFKK